MDNSNTFSTRKNHKSRPKFRHYNNYKNNRPERRPELKDVSALSVRVIYRGDSKEEKEAALEKALGQFKKILTK